MKVCYLVQCMLIGRGEHGMNKKEEERITFSKTKDGSKFLNDGATSFIFRMMYPKF